MQRDRKRRPQAHRSSADRQRDRTSLASLSAQVRKPLQRRDARQEKVLAALEHVERLDAVDAPPDRLLRYSERRALLLPPDDRIALVAGADEIAVVDPLLLQELDRGHRLGADELEDGAARHFVICFGQRVCIVRWSIRGTAPYEAMDVDIGQAGQ